jgi:hypothetical protein
VKIAVADKTNEWKITRLTWNDNYFYSEVSGGDKYV